MSQDFDSQFTGIQNDRTSPGEMSKSPPETPIVFCETTPEIRDAPDYPKTTKIATPKPPASHLKLVVSKKPRKKTSKLSVSSLQRVSSPNILAPVYKSAPAKSSSFTAEVRKRSPYNFTMVAYDPFHYLRCELPLKFEEAEGDISLICQFPTIDDDELVDFIDGDDDLLGMVLISFHMHILHNLFLFGTVHKAQNLIIRTTEEQFKSLGVYQEFIKHVDKIPTKKGMVMEITIPLPSNALTMCDEFIDDMTDQFRKTLWQKHRNNPTIRDYLKANVRFSVAR